MTLPSAPVELDLDLSGDPAPRVRLLDRLRHAKGHVSGESLASELGVSRASVFKHVAGLRRLGYAVSGAPGSGYRLTGTPGRLVPYEVLAAGAPPELRRIVYISPVTSTNDVALRLGSQGSPTPAAVLTDHQTAGRGRRGRRWVAPPGSSVLLSVLLRPRVPPSGVPLFSLAAALAAASAIAEVTGAEARVKWPNDVLVNGRKCGGVLIQMVGEAEAVHYVVIGVGINVKQRPDQFPTEVRKQATSLRIELGWAPDRARLAAALLRRLVESEQLVRAPAELIRRWSAVDVCLGAQLMIDAPQGRIEGVGEVVDEQGRLGVRLRDGTEVLCVAGDVTVVGRA